MVPKITNSFIAVEDSSSGVSVGQCLCVYSGHFCQTGCQAGRKGRERGGEEGRRGVSTLLFALSLIVFC